MNEKPPISSWPEIRPLKETDRAELSSVVSANGFHLLWPTHIVRKSHEVVGYFTMARVPLFHFWLHTEKIDARDSFNLVMSGFNIARGIGLDSCLIPCEKKSPFYPMVSHLRAKELSETTLFYKEL